MNYSTNHNVVSVQPLMILIKHSFAACARIMLHVLPFLTGQHTKFSRYPQPIIRTFVFLAQTGEILDVAFLLPSNFRYGRVEGFSVLRVRSEVFQELKEKA